MCVYVCVLYVEIESHSGGLGEVHRCNCGDWKVLAKTAVRAKAAAVLAKRHAKFPTPFFNPVCWVLNTPIKKHKGTQLD